MSAGKSVVSAISSGVIAQGAAILAGVIRLPLVISFFGVEEFARFAASVALWQLLATPGESARLAARQLSANGVGIRGCTQVVVYANACLLGFLVFADLAFAFLMSKTSQPLMNAVPLSVVAVAATFYLPGAVAIGALEGRGKFNFVNFFIIVNPGYVTGAYFALYFSTFSASTHHFIRCGTTAVVAGVLVVRK